MSYSNTPSIRSNAGKKPFLSWTDVIKTSTGVFTDTIWTGDVDKTYEITSVFFRLTEGTITGTLNMTLFSGVISAILYGTFTPSLYANIGGSCDIWCESGCYIQVAANVATQPFGYEVSLFGAVYKMGEGALD